MVELEVMLAKKGSNWYAPVKRGFDVCFSLVALVIFAPLMAIVAIAVRLDSRGPSFFFQERVGRDGQLFSIVKFRTMVDDAESMGPQVTAADDDRITRIGRLLRATKVDELPQLWNVLNGTMSLVGPRPQVPRYVAEFPTDLKMVILSVKPGITGPTALGFRHEESILDQMRDRESFYIDCLLPLKCKMDADYVMNCGVGSDVMALFRTASMFVRGLAHRALGRPIGRKFDLSDEQLAVISAYDRRFAAVVSMPAHLKLTVLKEDSVEVKPVSSASR
jgi:lipopolysaccharide/colanic/teichoic acid biosynthesis glycosyltransferase